jgi:hypothetical protein
MEKFSRPDHVRNGEVLQMVEEDKCPTRNEKAVLTALVTSCIRPAIENMLLKDIQMKR